MSPSFRAWSDLLDPRDEAQALLDPRPGSVNIPASELARRVHELPPRGATIQVLEPSEAAIQVLIQLGRRAVSAHGPSRPVGNYRLWKPSPWVERLLPELTAGPGLDLGCGSGRDAVYLAGHGFQMTAIDHLPDALDLARDLERRTFAPQPCTIQWICGDATETPPGPFALVLAIRFADYRAIAAAGRQLGPDGSLLIQSFSVEHRDRTGHPRSAEAVWSPEKVERLARETGLEIRRVESGEELAAHLIRPGSKHQPTGIL